MLTRVARFWQTPQAVRSSSIDAAGFSAFAEPGFARAALSLTASAVAQGVLVVADVRLAVTDAPTRRELNRYWLVETWANAHNQRNFLRAIQARVLEIA